MGDGTRRKTYAPPVHDHAATTIRAAERDDPDRAQASVNPLLDLQATAGNQAVALMVAQRAPGDATPVTADNSAVNDLIWAETWLRYVALRGNMMGPFPALPSAYRGRIAAIQSATGGPGPVPAKDLVIDRQAFGEARSAVKQLRAEHARLTPKAPEDVYDLADLAIERGQANFKDGPGSDGKYGVNQQDQGWILLAIQSSAEEELREAKSWQYDIPKALAELPSEAQALFAAARADWTNGAPNADKLTTPSAELDLVEFGAHAQAVVNSMRAKRAADMARARRREADALWEAGNEQMAALKVMLADKRSSAFRSGDSGALDDVSKSLGAVAEAIGETRSAAAIITDRVDQLNAAVSMVSKSGSGFISLPEVPASISGVADKLVSANEKIKQVIELLDLLGPAKTQLDEGLKYLKGVDLTLEHFAGKSANPFVSVYVGSYLSPGIKNCMASIGTIAGIIAADNKRNIEAGFGSTPGYVNWAVEFGGEAVYQFLVGVFKMGGAANLSDEAWAFLATHRKDLSAAVGSDMPTGRREVPSWVSANRQAVWESFYGSTRPPR